jgi:hypothetical protein
MMLALQPLTSFAQSDPDTAGAVIVTQPMDEIVGQTSAEIAKGIKGSVTETIANIDKLAMGLPACMTEAARAGTVGGPQTALSPNQLVLKCETDFRTGKIDVLFDSQKIYSTVSDLAAKEGLRIAAMINETKEKQAGFEIRKARAREGAQVLFVANQALLATDPTTRTPAEKDAVAAIARQITITAQEAAAASAATKKFEVSIARMAGLATYLDDWARAARSKGLDLDVTIHGEQLRIEALQIDTETSAVWEGPSAMPSILGDLGTSMALLEGFKDDPAALGQRTGGTDIVAADLPPVPTDDPAARQTALMSAFEQLGVVVPEEMKAEGAAVAADAGAGQ